MERKRKRHLAGYKIPSPSTLILADRVYSSLIAASISLKDGRAYCRA
jgi:hypothetical protein